MKVIDGGKGKPLAKANCTFEGAGIDPEIKQITATIVARAANIIRETEDAGMRPVFFYGQPKGDIQLVMVGVDFTPANKEAFAKDAQKMCSAAKASFAILLSESFCLKTNDRDGYEEWRKKNPDASLSEHPDACDILMATIETYHGNWMAMIEIKKTEDGREIDISDVKFTKADAVEGRFTSFLPLKIKSN